MTLTKTASVDIKAVGPEHDSGLQPGQFRALVSVFGNVDSSGDVVVPGAFAKSLKEWEASGDSIPLIWSHRWDDPFSNIGHVVKAEETSDGLEIVGEIDTDGNPTAAQVHRLLKARRVKQFSFAYDIGEGGYAAKADDASDDDELVFELRELALHEIGPCLLGVNRQTDLRDIKSPKTPGPKPGAPSGTTSQEPPRDDKASDPPRVNPASVLALTESVLITEGV